ncbi:HIR complex subunit [Pichia californica]|uniref:Protein HIR n=1 Tax=Pichia californica TaxID=460514 RepID=A0A9P7BHA4_9ASCO|nr:HIR complex subunit [[Candida] californica]
MHVVKFPWVKHAEESRSFEIYSVSVSPDGSRLATGGLDGKVKLWSIDTLNKYKDLSNFKNDTNIDNMECRPLCSMSRHAGAITCVRFCPNSRFLASGSDDKLILIWEKDEEKTRIMTMNRTGIIDSDPNFLNNGTGGNDVDLEHWTVRKRLVAHDNDIQDMAWAPDASILVTVGLDRSIVVWNGNTFEKIKRFDIHQSHVKGVVFDPAGKYFATCSDDRTMRIFRYRKGVNVDGTDMEFVVENIIRDPFSKSPLSTYFRRCSWSPDGLYIAAPNGTNEGVNANVVIKRGSWESELSLIGHRLPCEVCSFSPRLYDVEFNNITNKSSSRSETVIITAGQDKTLALWSSSCATPLCVVTEISAKSITDVAWNPNGLNVYLCGLDGVVLALFFDERELGHVVPWEENNRALIRYGKDRDMFFPESIEQLKLEEFAEKRGIFKKSTVLKTDRIKSIMGSTENNNLSNELNSATNSTKQVMNVLIPRSKKHPNKAMPVPKINPIINSNVVPTSNTNILTAKSQRVTITKNGKKRVAPTLISVSSNSSIPTTESVASTNSFLSSSSSNSSTELKNIVLEKKNKLNSILSVPYPPLPKHGLSTLTNSLRANLINDETNMENMDNMIDYIAETDNSVNNVQGKTKRGKSSVNGKQWSSSSSTFINGNNSLGNGYRYGGNNGYGNNNYSRRNSSLQFGNSENANKRRKITNPDWIRDSTVNSITVYGNDKNMTYSNILTDKKNVDDDEQFIEVRYENENIHKYLDHNDNFGLESSWNEFDSISQIVVKSTTNSTGNKKSIDNWNLFVNEKITCIGESDLHGLSYWCLCTENGRIMMFSANGRQLCGSIELGSNVVKLICNKEFVLCVCADGLIYSWEFKKVNDVLLTGKSIINGVSLAPIINTHISSIENTTTKKKIDIVTKLNSIYMISNGSPLVIINHEKNNFIYMYDPMLESWIEILNSWYVDILPKSKLEEEIKIMGNKDKILKFITSRFLKSKSIKQDTTKVTNGKLEKENSPNAIKIKEFDTDKLQCVYENWKSSNECVAECINRKLEKC